MRLAPCQHTTTPGDQDGHPHNFRLAPLGNSLHGRYPVIRRGAFLLLLLLAVVPRADGQAPPRQLTAIRDLEISGTANDLSPISSLSVSHRGWIAVGQRQDAGVRVFGPDGSERFRFGRNGAGPGEFRMLAGFSGWVGDTLWLADGVLNRLTMITPAGKLLRTKPFPAPNSAGRVSPPGAPSQLAMYVFGVDAQGWLLTSSLIRHASLNESWKKAASGAQSTIWRISPDGQEARFLGFEPLRVDGCREGPFELVQIQCPLTEFGHSPSGDRFVIARPGSSSGPQASFWITVVGPRGDSLVHRQLHYRATPTPRAIVDSSRAACRARESKEARRDACTELSYAPYVRHVHRVVLGQDHTIWLELRRDAKGRHWLLLSPAAETIGEVTFPPTFMLWVASRTTAWGKEEDVDGIESVVRYRIGR